MPEASRQVLETERVLVAAEVRGRVLRLDEPLSLWGGLDPVSGRIIDPRHPQAGECVTDSLLAMERGRGSSSASSILLEAVRLGTAPAAILLAEVDGILALGAAVAREMYGRQPAVLVLSPAGYRALETGAELAIDASGRIETL